MGADTPIWDLVIEDMKSRDSMGRRKYHKPLLVNDGRDTLQDAYEEALDLAVYLRKAIHERELREHEEALARAAGEGMVGAE